MTHRTTTPTSAPLLSRGCSLLLLAALLLPACKVGVGIKESDEDQWFRREGSSALQAKDPSRRTLQFLRSLDLEIRYQKEPRKVQAEIRDRLLETCDRDIALYLAELSYHQAKRRDPRDARALDNYRACAELAYAYLFDPRLGPPSSKFDVAYRWACDFYNRSLSNLLTYGRTRGRPFMGLGGETVSSFLGAIGGGAGTVELAWNPNEFEEFLSAYDYEVTGLNARSLTLGLGLPCIAIRNPTEIKDRTEADRFLPDIKQCYSVTLLVRFHGSILDRREQEVRQFLLDAYDPLNTDDVTIEGERVPLEIDFTTPIAYSLHITPKVSGLARMFDTATYSDKAGLFMLHPYEPDKIPVVLVHGLMSSPLTWVPMFNTLLGDRELRHKYQFWFFSYPTGNPIVYSASLLRESLRAVHAAFDPEDSNEKFSQMVVVGHSMGGLLTKLVTTDSGDNLWKHGAGGDQPFESLDLDPETKELVRRALFFEKLPFVSRVVFMSTPHRGSTFASSWIGRLGASLIKLPTRVIEASQEVRRTLQGTNPELEELRISSIDNLSPDHPLLLETGQWVVDLPAHSLIGNEDGTSPDGTDGIVPYWSSHLDWTQSEYMVHSPHSVQQKPVAQEELKRILHLHLKEIEAAKARP